MSSRRKSSRTRKPQVEQAKKAAAPEDDDPTPLVPVIDPDLKARLEKAAPELVREVEQRMMTVARFSSWRSDWPPPDILNEYLPEDRAAIIESLKERTAAGIARDADTNDRIHKRMDRGQVFGWIVAMASIGGGVALGIFGNSWPTTALGVVMVIAGVGGPSVARVLADRLYAQGRRSPEQRLK